MKLLGVSLAVCSILCFVSADIYDYCETTETTTAETATLTTAAETTSTVPSTESKTSTTEAPTTSPTTQATASSAVGRRRRDTVEECIIQNAECIDNNCTCKANYVPSADLSECNMESGASSRFMSRVLVVVLFAVLTLTLGFL